MILSGFLLILGGINASNAFYYLTEGKYASASITALIAGFAITVGFNGIL